jgi:YD repeat-containing protein
LRFHPFRSPKETHNTHKHNAYDNANRLQTVTDNSASSYTVTYTYETNSSLATNIVSKQRSSPRLTTAKKYDKLNRLTSISSVASGSGTPTINYLYDYNRANQRIRSNTEDGAYWLYQYDALGQVTSGKKYWADGTPVEGQQFEYAFNEIGNRTTTGGRTNPSVKIVLRMRRQ